MNWQPYIASAVVLAAVAWLIRRIWKTIRSVLRGEPSTASCGTCRRRETGGQATEVVELHPLKRKRP